MNLKESLAKLESLGDGKRRAYNVKIGAGKAKQFGVAMGDLRALAKKIKTNHAQALTETQLSIGGMYDGKEIDIQESDETQTSEGQNSACPG